MRHIALFLILLVGCTTPVKPAQPSYVPFDRAGYFESHPGMENDTAFVAIIDQIDEAKKMHASPATIADLTRLLIAAKQFHDEKVAQEALAPPPEVPKDCPSPVVDPEIVRRAADVLKNPSNQSRFIQWKKDYGDAVLGEREGDVQVVFVHDNIRYTIWYTGDLFSIWERPNGTRGQEYIQTYGDDGATGCLNFAIAGSGKAGDDSSRRYMRWNGIGDDLGVIENHTYWQQRYLKALKALIAQAPQALTPLATPVREARTHPVRPRVGCVLVL